MGGGASAAAAQAAEARVAALMAAPQDEARPQDGLKSPACAGGGLAARRQKPGLQVATHRERGEEGSLEKGERPPSSERKITRVAGCFSDFYTLGAEVMPSSNSGMDIKYAHRVSDGKQVVVKVRDKQKSFCDKKEEREWRRTTQVLLNLSHSESIAQIYEVKEDAQAYYVIMEKCDGMDLFETLHSERIDIGYAKAILRRLLEAVHTLHAKGCIHKDLKLENVMVSPAGTPGLPSLTRQLQRQNSLDSLQPLVKLIDFDTVEEFSPKVAGEKARNVVGTDQYIAQEAYAGQYSPASDIFAVGVIAFRLISGRFPFKDDMFDDKPGENWVGSPKMKIIQARLVNFNIDWTGSPWKTETKARDFTRWMLQKKRADRPTALQCLQHPFLERTGTTPALPSKGLWRTSCKGSEDGSKHSS